MEASVSKTALLITYRTKPGQRDALHRAFDAHVKEPVAANPKVKCFVKCNDDADPNAVHLFELYSDRAALDEVGGATWLADYNAALEPVLAGPPELAFTSPIWSKETDPTAIDEMSEPPPMGLFVQYRTTDGGRDAIHAAWEERVKWHIEAADAVRFFYMLAGEEPDLLCLFELYQDRTVLEVSGATDWFQAYRELIEPNITQRTVYRGTPVWIKGAK